MKSPNLRHCQAHSQNKGLSRASRLWTGRQGQPEPEGGNHGPREASSTKLQADFVANQEVLRLWMVDIHWRVTVFQLHWVCPHSRCVCFRGLHFSGSRLLCWELSEAGPGLFALPILSRSGLGSQVSHKWMESHTNMVGGVGWAASLPGHLNTAGAPGSKDTQHHVGGPRALYF